MPSQAVSDLWLLAPSEFCQVSVSHVFQILDADFACIETVNGELAKKREEFDPLAEAWILLSIRAFSI